MDLASFLLNGLAITVHVVLIVICVRSLSFRHSMAPVFFTFALVSNLMSLLYWLAYDLLRPDARMPFAANEFGEIGSFLLLASTLNTVFRGRFAQARREIFCTGLFAAASAALWIAWSGEWLQDILVGLSFGYLLCVCVRSMKQAAVLSRREWRLLGTAAALLLLLQGLTFALPEPWNGRVDYAAYAVMFLVLAWGFRRLIPTLLRREDPYAQLGLALFCWCWAVSTMYMSSGGFYLAANFASVCCTPLALLALHREEAAP